MKILLLSCLLLCLAIVRAAEEKDVISEETSGEKRLVFNTVRDLYDALVRASKAGVETLKKLLNSTLVSNLIDKLSGTAKRAALRILDYFRNKFGIESKPVTFDDVELTSYSILPRVGEKLQQIKDLIKLVVDARKEGTSIQDIVESNEFKDALEKLPEFLRKLVLLQVRIAEAVEKRRGGTKTYIWDDLEKHLKTAQEIMSMYEHFKDGNRREKLEIMNYFESAEGKALVQSLPESLRKPIDVLLTAAFRRFRNELARE